jgi:hypothetical protein
MAGPIVVSVIGDVRDLVSGTKTARGELSGLGRAADVAGRAIRGGLIAGTAAAVAVGAKSVKAASDSQQSIGASEAVFGKYADTVIRRSGQASEAVGLSANEYRELNNVTGAMLASAGTPLAKVANLTDQLTERAADLAATFGGSTRQAVEAIGSLLRGEADPIERYGISIKQSDVNARVAAKGLGKLTGAARKQADQQARLELLFNQSKTAAGQFGRESDTLAHKQQILGAKVTDLESKFGTLLLPVLADVADWASDKAVPALEDLAGWLSDNKDEFSDVATTVKGNVLPVLETVGDVVSGLVGFWGDLPAPVRDTAVQLGIAALVFPRVAAGVSGVSTAITFNIARLKQLRAEMTYTETRTATLSGAMTRMGAASRNAAGIAGMAALTISASSSNETLGRLGQTAGGALMGFAVGGPIGAAVGAGAGLLPSLATGAGKANDAMRDGEAAATDYASSLDEISGAATRATRAVALKAVQDSGALQAAGRLGVSTRDLVSAILGQEGAVRRVNAAIAAQPREELANGYSRLNSDAAALNSVLIEQGTQLTADARKARAAALATGDLSKVLRGVPKRIATKISQQGNPAELTRLLEGYIRKGKLVPKQIKTVVKATNLAPAGADVDKFVRTLVRNAGKAKTAGDKTGDGYAAGTRSGITKGASKAATAAGDVITKAKTSAASKATSGGNEVGGNLASGVAVGIYNGSSVVSGAAGAIIGRAIAAMRVAADSHSPSRKTARVGRDMGDGLFVGLQARNAYAGRAGRRLVGSVLDGMAKGAQGLNAMLDRLGTQRINAANKALNNYIRTYNREHKKNLTDKQVNALHKALNAKTKELATELDNVGKKVADLANKYAKTLELAKQTTLAARQFASITTVADFGIGAQSGVQGINNGLEARLNAVKAFQANMEALAKKGVNKSTLRQILEAGVDGGGAYAAALAAGSSADIERLNSLQAQINKSTKSLGDKITPKVTGLDPRAVGKAAERAANQIARILNKRVGVTIRVDANGRARTNIVGTGNGNARPAPQQFKIHLTAQQLSALERGRLIAADLAAYKKAGGR